MRTTAQQRTMIEDNSNSQAKLSENHGCWRNRRSSRCTLKTLSPPSFAETIGAAMGEHQSVPLATKQMNMTKLLAMRLMLLRHRDLHEKLKHDVLTQWQCKMVTSSQMVSIAAFFIFINSTFPANSLLSSCALAGLSNSSLHHHTERSGTM